MLRLLADGRPTTEFVLHKEIPLMSRVKFLRGTLALAVAVLTNSALAQDKKPAEKPADKPAAKPVEAKPADKAADKGSKPAAPADGDEMMSAMAAESAPGKEHEALKPMLGSFTCSTKFHAPGMPPMESTGTVERKWILGGRYMAEEFKGNAMGMPFEGFGITGYDKLQKFYHSYWIDSMATGTWTQTGTADATGKNFTFAGENFDPITKAKKKGKSTTQVISNDKHDMKMFSVGADGKETLEFEMSCTRK